MRAVAELLNAMRESGVVSDYALFGAAAQMRYTEPVATLDADVLVAVPVSGRIDVLAPIYGFCRQRGYEAEGEYWLTRPPAERLAAVEFLRRQHARPGARLRRVLRVVERHHVDD